MAAPVYLGVILQVMQLYIRIDNNIYYIIYSTLYSLFILVREFMHQIVSGIKYLHTHSILHRDLSLTNMLLTDDLKVKIADFGLAAQLREPGEQHYTLCGTPNYISPYVACIHMPT